MKELTAHEKAIRDKDTKDLTLPELKEKIRVVNKEVSQFNKDILELARQTHLAYQKRLKRIMYGGILKRDYNRRVMPPFNDDLK